MKNKLMTAALGAEAALCVLLCAQGGSVEAVLSFPLAPIGNWLRRLSLSGGAGNALAIVLYVLICLLPAGMCLFRWLKGKRCAEDLLLPAASAALFYSLYLLINPAMAEARYSLMAKPALNGLVWVLIVAWLVLVLLRMAFADRQGTAPASARSTMTNQLSSSPLWAVFASFNVRSSPIASAGY